MSDLPERYTKEQLIEKLTEAKEYCLAHCASGSEDAYNQHYTECVALIDTFYSQVKKLKNLMQTHYTYVSMSKVADGFDYHSIFHLYDPSQTGLVPYSVLFNTPVTEYFSPEQTDSSIQPQKIPWTYPVPAWATVQNNLKNACDWFDSSVYNSKYDSWSSGVMSYAFKMMFFADQQTKDDRRLPDGFTFYQYIYEDGGVRDIVETFRIPVTLSFDDVF